MLTESAYKTGLVRFYRDQKVIGAGFYVANGYVLTCAHVVTQALNLGKSPQTVSANAVAGKPLTLDSPFVAPAQPQTAEVVPSLWRLAEEDLAVLKVQDAVPVGVTDLPVQEFKIDWGSKYRIFGFPDGHPNGIWTQGKFLDEQAQGWVQLEDVKAQGLAIEPGFSGAPVWHEELKAIAGMTVARDKERVEAKVGFMIPCTKLKRAVEAVTLFELLLDAQTELAAHWRTAYVLLRHERMLEVSAKTLEEAILQILDLPSQKSSYLPIVQFVGYLALPELGLSIQLRLREWLLRQVDRVEDLLNFVRQQVQSVQPLQPQSPHLLFWVQAEWNSDRYSVRAYLVRNRDQYEPQAAMPLQVETEKVDRSALEATLREYLEESVAQLTDCSDLPNLQIHVFLPLACLDWPVDGWNADEPDSFNPAPESVGSRYRVVMRSAERFSHPNLGKPQIMALWNRKWSMLTDSSKQMSCELIAADDETPETLSAKLRQPQVVGLFHTRVPSTYTPENPGLFPVLCGAGAPVALWLRQDLPDDCQDHFAEFLEGNLAELPERMRQIRNQIDGSPGDSHLQQHAVLIWEDPKLVPPNPSVRHSGPGQRLRMPG